MPLSHDVEISNPAAYNFIYYTGANTKERENYFVPFSILSGANGSLIATPKQNKGQVKLPNLIPVTR